MVASLEYFLAVAENGGFIRAAEALSISQTAITKQVQLLERSLGCRLFDRSGKTTKLTDEGRFFEGQAREALAAFGKAEDNMRAHLAGERGTLRVGFITYMDQDLLVRIFASYVRVHPSVKLSFLSSSSKALHQMVKEGELDAYIGIGTSWDFLRGTWDFLPVTKPAREEVPRRYSRIRCSRKGKAVVIC